jgi:hypothetical protein
MAVDHDHQINLPKHKQLIKHRNYFDVKVI